jgi:hypothetical protein
MLSDTGIDDVKKQRNAEYSKHINDSVLSSLKMEGIRLLLFETNFVCKFVRSIPCIVSSGLHVGRARKFIFELGPEIS